MFMHIKFRNGAFGSKTYGGEKYKQFQICLEKSNLSAKCMRIKKNQNSTDFFPFAFD